MIDWLPPLLDPLTPVTALLMVGWFLSLSLAIHRMTRYLQQSRLLTALPDFVDDMSAALGDADSPAERGSLLPSLLEAARREPSLPAFKRFYEDVVFPLRRPDHRNERSLQALVQIAPLLGLIGTVAGILTGFAGLAQTQGIVTLRELAGPISLALRTTLHGAACAAFCIAVRAAFPMPEIHQQVDRRLLWAWRAFAPVGHKKQKDGRRRARPSTKLDECHPEESRSDDENPKRSST